MGAGAEHFRHEHYLCEDTICRQEHFQVWSTEAELHQHRVKVHGDHMSRHEKRQAMRIPLDINVSSSLLSFPSPCTMCCTSPNTMIRISHPVLTHASYAHCHHVIECCLLSGPQYHCGHNGLLTHIITTIILVTTNTAYWTLLLHTVPAW